MFSTRTWSANRSRCHDCDHSTLVMMTVDHPVQVPFEGKTIAFVAKLRMQVCQHCGRRRDSRAVDHQINTEVRKRLGLLTSAEMNRAMAEMEMTVGRLAERLRLNTDKVI